MSFNEFHELTGGCHRCQETESTGDDRCVDGGEPPAEELSRHHPQEVTRDVDQGQSEEIHEFYTSYVADVVHNTRVDHAQNTSEQ